MILEYNFLQGFRLSILNSQVVSLSYSLAILEVTNFCAVMDTLVNQDAVCPILLPYDHLADHIIHPYVCCTVLLRTKLIDWSDSYDILMLANQEQCYICYREQCGNCFAHKVARGSMMQ